MDERFSHEIDEFKCHFSEYSNKRIVLYGIGRMTATLLEEDFGFNFVGLLDREPENIGKIIFGLPIMSVTDAETKADIVIINTGREYWKLIYERIKGMRIPIFCRDGSVATAEENDVIDNPFYAINSAEMFKQIKAAEVISFDFYDTLYQRLVCNPRDVFRLLQREFEKEWIGEKSFYEVRGEAIQEVEDNYSLDELYAKIAEIGNIDESLLRKMKRREEELEEVLLYPRESIIKALKFAASQDKEIYIISDMYLTTAFYREVFEQAGIDIRPDHILITGEAKAAKNAEGLWRIYKDIIGIRTAIHIGDDKEADIGAASRVGIEGVYVPKAWDMLEKSTAHKLQARIVTDYSSCIFGLILYKLFQDPFSSSDPNGVVEITSIKDFGYIVFGPVILTFLLWVYEQAEQDNIERLIFLGRDGYFLVPCFEKLCEYKEKVIDHEYFAISRQLALMSGVQTDEELMAYAMEPYTGDLCARIYDRFGVMINEEDKDESVEDYIREYMTILKERVEEVRTNFKKYADKFKLSDKCALVDDGYNGTNQKKLNEIMNLSMPGYYMSADLSERNNNAKMQRMKGCFQEEDDLAAEKCALNTYVLYLESYLTAPYGMVREIKEDGSFVCAPDTKNQELFDKKIELNQGVIDFIEDYMTHFGKYKLPLDTATVDWYYDKSFHGMFRLSQKIKDTFYYDNAMMNRMESPMFGE